MTEIKIQSNLNSIIDFSQNENKEIIVSGMIQNLRVLGWGAFLILRTPCYTIQTVIDAKNINIDLASLQVESAVKVRGIVKQANIKDKSLNPRNYEMHVNHIEILSSPSINPLPVDTTKKEMNVGLDTKFNMRPLTLRHPNDRAIFRIASVICNEFENFLKSINFTRINTPKIVFSGAEGGANIFKIDYFNRKAFLAQSPQFYKQMMVGVFGRVFEIGPVFRAEEHDTSRHLNEYISMDIEMGFINGFEDLIQIEVNLLQSIFKKIEEECQNEIQLLNINLPKIEKILLFKLDEIHEIIFKEYSKDHRGEKDLHPEEERLICEYSLKNYNTEFVFATHFPTEKRPFYTMEDPSDTSKTLSFDLLFRGLEITTGGQRLHKYEDYVAKMKKLGMNVECFESYLQTFKYGMPPHGGFGLGLERLTSLLCNLSNVKEASLFPRDINRLEP
jgi:nondiscriminating aspartyl-tRNA synthetase